MNTDAMTLADYTAALRFARTDLVEKLNAGIANSLPIPDGKWSPAQIAYHLHLTERGITVSLKRLKNWDKSELNGVQEPASDERLRKEWSRIERGTANRSVKVSAPERLQPLSAPELSECLQLLEESRKNLWETLESLSLDELRAVQVPHPAFGVMTGCGWLFFLANHERRHTAQLDELYQLQS